MRNVEALSHVKTSFFKRALGLHRTTRNRLVRLLAHSPLLFEDLRRCIKRPTTKLFKTILRKLAEVDGDFFASGRMKNNA